MIKKTLNLFFVSRPVLLIPMWAYFVFGYYHGAGSTLTKYSVSFLIPYLHYPIKIIYGFEIKTAGILFAFSLLLAGIHVLNQIADIEADKRNPGLPLIARGIVPENSAKIQTIIMFSFALILSLIINYKLSIWFVIALILVWVYSMPPLRFSGRPIFDFLSNALGYGFITFCLGFSCSGNSDLKKMLFQALPYFLLMISGSIASTIPDIPGDQADRKRTTSVRFGIRISALIGLAALFAAGVIGWIFYDLFVVIISFFALFPFLRLVILPMRQNAYSAYQVGGGLLVAIGLILCPPLLLLSVVLTLGTKLFYLIYYGIDYPKMGK
jgi:4-hydroxybenzoate polyprenyltransferase